MQKLRIVIIYSRQPPIEPSGVPSVLSERPGPKNLTPITREETSSPAIHPRSSTPTTSPSLTSITLQTADTMAPLITNTGLMSVDTVILKAQDTLMSYSEAPTVTLEDVAFAEIAAQPLQQVQTPVKDEQDKNGYTSYEEFAKKYQHYLETEDDLF